MRASYSLPRWADLVLLPIVCLGLALLLAGLVVLLVGQDPVRVMTVLMQGALGTPRGLSYTLYYATTFIFTGLAVAVAFHGGLFNIGGEGQAIMGGLGTGLAGRVGIHELLLVTPTLRHLIQTAARPEQLQFEGMQHGQLRTLRQDGIHKVLSGLTSIEEVRANSNI